MKMSLARIQRALAETQQQRQKQDKENSKLDMDPSTPDTPQISLSWRRQTSSLSYPCPDPLPLANLGALLFSLSGFPISKSAETFNVTWLEKTSQVLVVVVENMSMRDLSEKPNALLSFRRIVAENGFSVVLQPSLAFAHSTGSDLSQVELSFSDDARIITALASEISGTRKLKPVTERSSPFVNSKDVFEKSPVAEESSSDDVHHDDISMGDVTDIRRHIREFATRFSSRHNYSVELQDGQVGHTLLHPKKRHALSDGGRKRIDTRSVKGKAGESAADEKGAPEDGAPLSKISKPDLKALMEKLERLNREHMHLEHKMRKLQTEHPKGVSAKSAAQFKRTKDQLRLKAAEFRRAKEEWEHFKQESGQVTTADSQEKEKGRQDLLEYLNRITAPLKQDRAKVLTPVGTVLPPGNLDRSKPEMFDRRYLLLSLTDMKLNGFNLACSPTRKKYEPVTPQSRMFGVDCEMCLTMNMISELTRITVVDEDGVIRLDELVKPRGKIINYLTQYSGITAEMMVGVTTTREEIVRRLYEILPPDAILVGHSLDSDLKALCLTHPYCIDTSVCYSVRGGHQKSKLKVLMKTFLGEDIQTAGDAGHSSAEDSFAALKLVLLKLQHDISFGDVDMNPSFEWDGVNYTEALSEAMNIVSHERRSQSFHNSWVFHPHRRPKAFKRDVDPMALIGMTPEENKAYLVKRDELRRVAKERGFQEMALREIQCALRDHDEVGFKVLREHKRREAAFRKLQKDFHEDRQAVVQKLDVLDRQRKDVSKQYARGATRQGNQPSSIVVLLAKRTFIKAKIAEMENGIKATLPNQRSKLKQLRGKIHRLRDELKQVNEAVTARDKEHADSKELPDKPHGAEPLEADVDDANNDSSDEVETMVMGGEPDGDTSASPNEGAILKMVEESVRALQAIKQQEDELRKELERNEALARKAVLEMRIEKRHQEDETLARRIVEGTVNLDEVFADEAVLQQFVRYQLFVQRKNEEFVRKRGYGFGTVALEKLYLNMFSAWKMAQKKSVVVAEESVANVHYDGVKIIPPKDSSIRSTIKATRYSLATHDLVVSHLLYDDVHENEDEIESGLCHIWDGVKRGGVVVVILEGSYHFKQIGLGLGMIAIKK